MSTETLILAVVVLDILSSVFLTRLINIPPGEFRIHLDINQVNQSLGFTIVRNRIDKFLLISELFFKKPHCIPLIFDSFIDSFYFSTF